MRITASIVIPLAAAAVVAVASIHDAKACGGCFHPPVPPGQPVSVITDHRMILSISPQQSTLYDEIRYQGDPADFAWVLPISGTATIGLSSDTLFSTVDLLTQTTVQAPPMNCPAAPTNCNVAFGAGGAEGDNAGASSDASAPRNGGVDVVKEQVVGPYETVQLHSTDPNALTDWLTAHSYVIPDDVKPIIAAYVNEHFDFLAMKLVPGQGVHAMRPVRVSTPGASPVLPLRMVAAGTGAQVGITLWVFGDGRYEPQNFSSFRIQDADLVWDWNTSSSNYATLRQSAEQAANFATWEIESSTSMSQSNLTVNVQSAVRASQFGPDASVDYPPTDAGDGGAGETSDQLLQDDLNTLFAGIADPLRVTRMRADLAHAALATDLVLQASADQSALTNVRQATKEANEPLCPVYDGCQYVGQAPRSQAIARMQGNGSSSFACAITERPATTSLAIAAVLGTLGIVVVGARRRRS